MDIEIKHVSPREALMYLVGRLDIASAESFRSRLKEVTAGLERLIVDLREVSFIDSSGLSALVNGYKVMRAQNGELALTNLQAQARMALELTRLDQVLPTYKTPEAAFAPSEGESP